jgi:hypothetical protein
MALAMTLAVANIQFTGENNMSDPNTRLSLHQAYQQFANLIDSLSNEQFLSSMNGWAPRDVVAHLIGWNGLMIEASSAILGGHPPSYYDDAPNDYSNINASFTTKHASQSKPELLAELQSSVQKLETFLDSLPIEELTADHGVTHHNGEPATVADIIDSLAADYLDHSDEIKAWLINKPQS